MRMRWLVASTLLVAACASGPRYSYPESAREFMNDNCSNEDAGCACVHRGIQDNMPYEDYRRYMFENDTLSQEERTRINDELNRLNSACLVR